MIKTPAIIHKLRNTLERIGFDVCNRLGEIIGIPANRVRMYFIYASFVTFGSPLIIYLILAFFRHVRQYLREGRRRMWFDV